MIGPAVKAPFFFDEARDGVDISHLIDRSEPGSWAEAIFVFPHSLRILDDASSDITNADGSVEASSRSGPVLLPLHSQPTSREPRRNGH